MLAIGIGLAVTGCRVPGQVPTGAPESPPHEATPTLAPVASPTGTATTGPSPTPPPTPTPSPSPSPTPDPAAIAAWAEEVCSINTDLAEGTQSIIEQLPEPSEDDLAALQSVNEQRQPLILALLEEVAARLAAVQVLEDGAPFQAALQAEMEERRAAAVAFFDAVAAAETADDYEAAVLTQAAAAQEATFASARSIPPLPPAVTAALTAIDDCRAFELDARGVPRDLLMPSYGQVALDDDLATADGWTLPQVDGAQVAAVDGAIRASFDGLADRLLLAPPDMPQRLPAVRIEATMSLEGLAFSGAYCLSGPEGGYAAQLTGTGVLLLLRRDGETQTTLARRVLDEPPNGPLVLALECASDEGAVALAAEVDGQRLLEYQDQSLAGLADEAGLVAHTLGLSGSATIFDSIRVSVP
jgi:hypothetical protein